MEQNHFDARVRVSVSVKVDVMTSPLPPFLHGLMTRFDMELLGKKGLHFAPDGLGCISQLLPRAATGLCRLMGHLTSLKAEHLTGEKIFNYVYVRITSLFKLD